MAQQLASVDISTIPELARLADEVQRTRQARVLRRDGEDVALLVPVMPLPRRRAKKTLSRRFPDIASLAGAAGSLPRPLTWQEIEEIVRDERAEAYRDKHL